MYERKSVATALYCNSYSKFGAWEVWIEYVPTYLRRWRRRLLGSGCLWRWGCCGSSCGVRSSSVAPLRCGWLGLRVCISCHAAPQPFLTEGGAVFRKDSFTVVSYSFSNTNTRTCFIWKKGSISWVMTLYNYKHPLGHVKMICVKSN